MAAAEFVLSSSDSNNTCSNLSSSLALKVITEKYGGVYYTSAVGEINVVEKMKKENAIIGGEGNGGVIYPKTHYGRDSLIGIVLILSLLAERNISLSELRKTLPQFSIVKKKLNFDGNIKNVVDFFKQEYLKCKITGKEILYSASPDQTSSSLLVKQNNEQRQHRASTQLFTGTKEQE